MRNVLSYPNFENNFNDICIFFPASSALAFLLGSTALVSATSNHELSRLFEYGRFLQSEIC